MSTVAPAQGGVIDGRYAWFRMGVSMLIGAIGSVGMWAVVVVLPAVQAEFAVDRGGASLPYTATMIGFAFGNVVLGRLTDRWGITIPTIGAVVALGLGFMLAAASSSLWLFALIQGLLIGTGTAAGFGPLIANISHWFRRRRGIAVAAVASGNYIAGAIWPNIISAAMPAYGWRDTYFAIGVVCIIVLVPLALLLRRSLPPEEHAQEYLGDHSTGALGQIASPPKESLLAIGISPRILQVMLIAAGVGCCVAMSMPQVHLVAYAADLGYGVARGAEMLSLMLAAGIVSRLASGWLADHIGGVRTLLLGSVLQGLALFLYLPFDGLASLYIVSLIFGLAQGGIVPSYAIIVREYLPAREAGQRIGTVIMATVFGMALGGWMSGWIFDLTGSYQAAFIHGIAWNLMNIAVMVTLLWHTRTARAVVAA